MLDSADTGIVAFYDGKAISRKTFLSHVGLTSQILPKHQYSINQCENRYHFLVIFAACVILKQVSLLPGSRANKEIERYRNPIRIIILQMMIWLWRSAARKAPSCQ